MKIKIDTANTKELVGKYVGGLTVPKTIIDTGMVTWYSEVQRIVENALVTYDKKDIQGRSFLEPVYEIEKNEFKIILFKDGIERISIKVPFIEEAELVKLTQEVEVTIK